MVCLGNICRSPLAHGILEHLAKQKGFNWEIDSAGTGSWHIGNQPDRRSIAVAKNYGVDITSQRARQFNATDFDHYDFIFVMDENNYKDVIRLAKTQEQKDKVRLFIPNGFVPDPYWDDSQFDTVYRLIHAQCEKLIESLNKEKLTK